MGYRTRTRAELAEKDAEIERLKAEIAKLKGKGGKPQEGREKRPSAATVDMQTRGC